MVKDQRGTKSETSPIEWEEAMLIVEYLNDTGDYNTCLMIASGFYFGLLISDILELRWEQVLSDSFEITEQKSKQHRHITLNDTFKELRDQIVSAMDSSPKKGSYIFTSTRKGADRTKPISITAANKRIRKAFQSCDIQIENPSSHTLRKTFGLRVYNRNNRSSEALNVLMELFNHSNTAITKRYIGVYDERIDNVYLTI